MFIPWCTHLLTHFDSFFYPLIHSLHLLNHMLIRFLTLSPLHSLFPVFSSSDIYRACPVSHRARHEYLQTALDGFSGPFSSFLSPRRGIFCDLHLVGIPENVAEPRHAHHRPLCFPNWGSLSDEATQLLTRCHLWPRPQK